MSVLPFPPRPSRRLPRNKGQGRRERPPPAGHVVEVVGLDLALRKSKDALFGRPIRIPQALLVAPNGTDRATKLLRQRLLRKPIHLSPCCQFHNGAIHNGQTLPKWLSYSLALWQYANMAKGQIVYIRRVANDLTPPNRIQELLDAKGMKQAELARLANVTVSALNKVVKGTRGLDQDWMRRLAPHLGVSPAELLPREDNPLVLSEQERELLERYRAADTSTQDQLRRVSAAIIPFGHKPADAA